jgi:hypothetical protein
VKLAWLLRFLQKHDGFTLSLSIAFLQRPKRAGVAFVSFAKGMTA